MDAAKTVACSHLGCSGPATHRPILQTRSRSSGKTTGVTLCQLGYCDEHRQSYKIENLLSSEGFTKLAKFMREKGHPEPEQKLTTLAWHPLSEDDLEDLTTSQQHTSTGEDELAF